MSSVTSEQIAGLVRFIMTLLSGYAIKAGLDSESWLAVTSGVVSIVVALWSWYSNSPHQILAQAASNPNVEAVVVNKPGLAKSIPNDKVISQ